MEIKNQILLIKQELKNRKMTYEDLSKISNIPVSTLMKILSGHTSNPRLDTINAMTNALFMNSNNKIRIPVLGAIPAGVPIEAIENIIDWEEITPEMANLGELFALRVKGDSMLPRIIEGDVVIVKQQDYADNGDTVVVYVNGYEATLKKIKFSDAGIYLIPNNPAYEAKFFTKAEVQTLPVRIYGKVIELRGKI